MHDSIKKIRFLISLVHISRSIWAVWLRIQYARELIDEEDGREGICTAPEISAGVMEWKKDCDEIHYATTRHITRLS